MIAENPVLDGCEVLVRILSEYLPQLRRAAMPDLREKSASVRGIFGVDDQGLVRLPFLRRQEVSVGLEDVGCQFVHDRGFDSLPGTLKVRKASYLGSPQQPD